MSPLCPVGLEPSRKAATSLGLVAILFWSTTIAFSRSLSEQLGTVTAAAAIHLAGGTLGCMIFLRSRADYRRVFKLPRPYLLGCGGLFGLYGVTLYLAIGLSVTRQQVVEIGIINYLWPGLTLAFSIPLLKQRGKIMLLPGIIVSLIGVALVMWQPNVSMVDLWSGAWAVNPWPYLLALVAAVSWGLYSNFARRSAYQLDTRGAVPIFLLVTGLLLACARLFLNEQSHFSGTALLELGYLALVPTVLAYVYWDIAARRGDLNLIATFSYLTPLFSTLASCLYLRVFPGVNIFVGCLLVIGGALVCRASIQGSPYYVTVEK